VAGRLFILVLLPMVALGTVAVPVVVDARRDVTPARAVERSAGSLTDLVRGVAAVNAEQADSDSVLNAVDSGVPVEVASTLLHFDLQAQMERARRRTDQALARIGTRRGRQWHASLVALRRRIDAGTVPTARADSAFRAIGDALEHDADATMRHVRRDAEAISGSSRTMTTFTVLGWTYDLVRASAAQSREISLAWFGEPAARRAATLRLAENTGLYADAGAHLAADGPPRVARAWARVRHDASVRRYEALFAKAMGGLRIPLSGKGDVVLQQSTGMVAVDQFAKALPGISARARLIGEVVEEANRATVAAAADLTRARAATYQWTVALLTGAALLTTAVAFAFARSISRPLQRLARTAGAVVDGRLDVEPLAARGPSETAVVATAFNALLDNLRLLEAKAHALATCDFDDPVVNAPLPGRLGESLQDSVRVLFGSIRDREQLHDRLAYEATHDPLTGLQNRAAAIAAIELLLAQADRGREVVALLSLDLDNFKRANDVHGHHNGDRILCEVGRRLQDVVRGSDVVARVGADEFLVVACVHGTDDAQDLAERAVAEIARPMHLDASLTVTLGASLGLTLSETGDHDPLELLTRADVALSQAKSHAHQAIGVYDAQVQQQLAEREATEQALRDALAQGGTGLVLHFQPVVDAHTGQLRALEALVRWERDGVVVPPDAFVPVAEASDLVIELDKWVMRAAAEQAAAWSARADLAVPIAVNVSGRHLASGRLPAHLAEVLATTRVAPQRLTIEITETVLLDDLSDAAAQLHEVRGLGVKVAVDDFGTGYTSLAHLQQLPVDTIKVDRCFVNDLARAKDASLVRMITELGHHLDLTIVAEGVETEQQWEVLEALGVDRIQGWVVSRAVPAHALATPLVPDGPRPAGHSALSGAGGRRDVRRDQDVASAPRRS
jgi:diguanylate cyclase (GGDEF)-like protein